MTPPIHMDPDSVRAVMQLLTRKEGELRTFITDLNRAVLVLEEGEWVGEAPNQFYYEYGELRRDILGKVDEMTALADRLKQAVSDWEAAAAKLGQGKK